MGETKSEPMAGGSPLMSNPEGVAGNDLETEPSVKKKSGRNKHTSHTVLTSITPPMDRGML